MLQTTPQKVYQKNECIVMEVRYLVIGNIIFTTAADFFYFFFVS